MNVGYTFRYKNEYTDEIVKARLIKMDNEECPYGVLDLEKHYIVDSFKNAGDIKEFDLLKEAARIVIDCGDDCICYKESTSVSFKIGYYYFHEGRYECMLEVGDLLTKEHNGLNKLCSIFEILDK